MTRASTLPALVLSALVRLAPLLLGPTLIGGCGTSSGAPSAEAAPSPRPVRLADHETLPEAEGERGEARTVAVTAPPEDGPQADPPPVEPPSFAE